MSSKERSQPFGNYRNYYSKRREKDDNNRVNQLNESYFKDKKCLDIGCNTGVLTVEIAKKFDPNMIIGIDYDEDLIHVANNEIKSIILKNINKTKINSFVPRSVTSSAKKASISSKLYPHNSI